ncbi:hypothetical protein H112_08347 [Trichophyton rubrum D6]|uniref:Uncharacterized protein n=2 Tax=Trichophyton TaxID=5550 RepID=A0A022VPZ4_TRIRU|nr:hypothetical protein H100_08369 [Trichophyton rubrum MR850]EZF37259.1 hypothetical protein H102_08329 [Trichophyton rubrum CBS 100081]EZF48014.1 hypothetical protein H103_08352 [Trichophyton rubrum CBS 288.86]EZF58368.1 hypothetical protein H104_08303 [Trichophyton rubrum CBS 289.86]EZF69214.1 hypothetical protein H105_08356 [Trichophyton soudanense CBS 452.61]EZF79839.1 hypothetical protein H110_08352 [Trichophyton rubrum MR1448]EZF90452.1 hypothetical protein H113_08421 [Trichophyton rub
MLSRLLPAFLLRPLGLSSPIRRTLRSPTPCKSFLTADDLPRASRRFLATKLPPAVSGDVHTSPTPRLVAEGDFLLSSSQVEDLFAGRFPTDCDRDVLVFKGLSQRDWQRIVQGFRRSLSGREGKPSGYLVYGGFHTTSILRAPPSNIHDALIWNIVDLVLNTLKQATRDDEKYSFQVMMNTSASSRDKTASMKIPDIRIARRERAPRRGKIPRDEIVFVAEIGFTEGSSDLEKSIKQWFNVMPEVKVAFLVKLDERPRFNSKRAFSHLPDYVIKNPSIYANANTAASINNEGMAEIHGVSFVGNITAYLEIWTRSSDGNAELSGERIKFYDSSQLLSPPRIELDMTAFGFSSDQRQHDKLILDWKGWDEALQAQTGELACKRFFSIIHKFCMTETEGSETESSR